MNISANMENIRSLGNQVKAHASDYTTEVNALYAKIDTLSNAWKGADNEAYIGKVNSYKADVQKLGEIINSYGDFLIDTAKYLADVQQQVSNAANKL